MNVYQNTLISRFDGNQIKKILDDCDLEADEKELNEDLYKKLSPTLISLIEENVFSLESYHNNFNAYNIETCTIIAFIIAYKHLSGEIQDLKTKVALVEEEKNQANIELTNIQQKYEEIMTDFKSLVSNTQTKEDLNNVKLQLNEANNRIEVLSKAISDETNEKKKYQKMYENSDENGVIAFGFNECYNSKQLLVSMNKLLGPGETENDTIYDKIVRIKKEKGIQAKIDKNSITKCEQNLSVTDLEISDIKTSNSRDIKEFDSDEVEINKLKEELNRIKEELNKTNEKNSDLEAKISEREIEVNKIKEELNKSKEENKELEEMIEENLNKSETEIKLLKEELSESKIDNNSLVCLEDSMVSEEEVAKLKEKIREVEEEKTKIMQECEEKISEKDIDTEVVVESLNEEVNKVIAELNKVKKKSATLKQEYDQKLGLKDEQICKLHKEIGKIKEDNDIIKGILVNLQRRLSKKEEELKKEKDKKHVKEVTKIEEIQNENSKLKEILEFKENNFNEQIEQLKNANEIKIKSMESYITSNKAKIVAESEQKKIDFIFQIMQVFNSPSFVTEVIDEKTCLEQLKRVENDRKIKEDELVELHKYKQEIEEIRKYLNLEGNTRTISAVMSL